MSGNRNRLWPAHVRRDLRRMWRSGMSARQIAEALNARHGLTLTRNAVIGKLWRMGLRHEARQGTVRRHRRRVVSATRRRRHRPVRRQAPVKMQAAPTPERKRTAPAPTSARRGITDIMQLKPGMCRWVDGDRGAWVWCGAPTDGGSWCEYHRAIVFRKAKEEKQPCPA